MISLAFPDQSKFDDWKKKANELNKLGYKINVSDYIEQLDCESETDLVDNYIYLRNKKTGF